MNAIGTVTAVAVLHRLRPNHGGGDTPSTAIDKRSVDGRIPVKGLGLSGDVQCDRKHHGGTGKAVYAYADEDAAWWSAELDREITPGLFGENLRTSGIDVTGAEIGERWQVGSPQDGVLLEVTSPRTPCRTFQDRMGEPRWVKRFTQHNRPGAYFRVLEPGGIAAGDEIQIVHRPGHGVTIGDFLGGADAATMRRLVDAAKELDLDLDPSVRKVAARALKRG
jgi:MOSC domain-containing protein YiiM